MIRVPTGLHLGRLRLLILCLLSTAVLVAVGVSLYRKNRADHDIHRVVNPINGAQLCGETVGIDELRHRLYALLTEAVGALDRDQLSEESFQSFRGVWQIARDVIGECSRSVATERTARSELPPDFAEL